MPNSSPASQTPAVCIQRKAFNSQKDFDETFLKSQTKKAEEKGLCNHLSRKIKRVPLSTRTFWNCLLHLFPILAWFPKYSWREHVISDIAAGLTVAVMHIPQGMGYALLGNVDPIVGIYMAFFPVLIYFLLGTSHHISMGTFAVTTLMTGKVVDQFCRAENTYNIHSANSSLSEQLCSSNAYNLTNIEVATAVCLMVGLIQLAMSIFRLGIIGVILSEHLVSGFTTGAAVHVLVSQVRNILGIKIPRFNGPFRLIHTVGAIFVSLPSSNLVELLISSLTLTFLGSYNHWAKPRLERLLHFPLPVELCILIITTLASYYGKLNATSSVRTLNHIPTGLPPPRVPPVGIFSQIVVDSLTIAVVSYAVSLSLAKIFAHRHRYKVSDNQELFAQGAANIFGAFFSCMPISASLSRSMLQESVGSKTQLSSLISCVLLLLILLWLGPLFEPLPLCVLSSIIVVALRGMFVQVNDFLRALKVARFEAAVWMVTFLSVVIIDVEIGLAIGALTSVCLLIYRGNNPYRAILGRLPDTELYEDLKLFPCAVEEEGMKIFRWVGSINFTNAEYFRKTVMKCVDAEKQGLSGQMCPSTSNASFINDDIILPSYGSLNLDPMQRSTAIKYLILDCSGVSYVDLAGSETLASINIELETQATVLILSSCSDYLASQLECGEFFLTFPKCRLYPTILDAISSLHGTASSTND